MAIDGCVNQCQTVIVYIDLSKIDYLDMGYINIQNIICYRTKNVNMGSQMCKIISKCTKENMKI
jgi:hypothetical protein